jgi:hypothetical protein
MRRPALLLRLRCALLHPLQGRYRNGLCLRCHVAAARRGRL